MIYLKKGCQRKGGRRPAQAALAGLVLASMLAGAFPATALAAASSQTATVGEEANKIEKASPQVEARIQKTIDLLRSLYPEFGSLNLQMKFREKNTRMMHGQRLEREEWILFFDDRQSKDKKSEDWIYNQVHMNFDETGALISYSWQNPNWAGTDMPDKAMASKKAKEFLQKLIGADLDRYASGSASSTGTHGAASDGGKKVTWTHRSVQFEGLVNGIPLMNSSDNWTVDVDGKGRIVGVHHWNKERPDPALYPDPAKAITLEAAKRRLAEQTRMVLSYQPQEFLNQHPGGFADMPLPGRKPMVLVYMPDSMGYIDAFTGNLSEGFNAAADGFKKMEATIRITGQGKERYVRSPEEGRRFIEKDLGFDMTGMTFFDALKGEEEEPAAPTIKRYHWDEQARMDSLIAKIRPDKFRPRYASLTTESDTGRVCGFSIGRVYVDSERQVQEAKQYGAIPAEEAKKKAVSFLQSFLPARTIEMKLLEPKDGQPTYPDWVDLSKLPQDFHESPVYDFIFIPIHDGVPVEGLHWHVSVDKATGTVWSFTYFPVDFDKLPSKRGLLSPEAAKERYLKNLDMKEVYLWPEFFNQRAPKPQLVYMPAYETAGVIDAKTGKPIPFVKE
ncbi:hypothetical protein HM1_0829 [Heliomicrobium modesticaldum Ice1]|uniref:YcdB/YcdC repeated domain-containing protein n=1 Tax=Heliobacterium modesticaldum (strain ATCC 51547 / Ice1) TaxID=498761 RepID=B0TAS9_HELMI|nr:YcdB/YcdC domain-containing protein [Heliomicrobium modesticaldum]ABZ83731.1 hypothetical protein HM1_0829 [Heliomicrobium modesticaldum Ice1]